MNVRSIILLLLVWSGSVARPAVAVAGKPNLEMLYSARASALVFQSVSTAFLKTPGRPGDVRVSVTFQLDREAHVHNLVIVPEKGGQWAEDTARATINALRFERWPKERFDQIQKELVNVHTYVGITGAPDSN